MSDIRKILDIINENSDVDSIQLHDSFDIELSEDFVIETGVIGFTKDGIILEADETLFNLLSEKVILEGYHPHLVSKSKVKPRKYYLITKDGDQLFGDPGSWAGPDDPMEFESLEEVLTFYRQMSDSDYYEPVVFDGKEFKYIEDNQQGVAEGLAPGQAAWKQEMIAKGAVKFQRDQHGGGAVDRIVAYNKYGKVVGGFNRKGVAEARSPEEFVRQMDAIAATPQTFEVGDWVTIDPNETSGYASSGMIGRIVELYNDEGESMAKIAVGGGSGVQTKMKTRGGVFGPPGTTIGLGKGVRSSGTHTVVPTSILQKYDPEGVAKGTEDKFAVPDQVESLVKQHSLYNEKGYLDLFAKLTGKPLDRAEIEPALDYASKLNRLLHSIRMRSEWRGTNPKQDQELIVLANQWMDLFNESMDLFNKSKNSFGDNHQQGVAEGFDGEYDDEAGMFKNDLQTIQRVATDLEEVIKDNENLPEWCQTKISTARSMIVTVMDYMISQHENGIIKTVDEAKYQGREVPLNKPMQGDVAKSKVYVKGPKGNVVKVNFGDKNMRIKKSNPNRRRSFRARHRCENPGPKWKARYWSCKAW